MNKRSLDSLIRMRNVVFALTVSLPLAPYVLSVIMLSDTTFVTRQEGIYIAMMLFAGLLILTLTLTDAINDVRLRDRNNTHT